MKEDYAEQYVAPCVLLEGPENDPKELDADKVIEFAKEIQAFCPDLVDEDEDGKPVFEDFFVIMFPDRSKELYTESALRSSLRSRKWTSRATQSPTASQPPAAPSA